MPKPSNCVDCSAHIEQKPGRGRSRLRCPECVQAREARRVQGARPKGSITCCHCGKVLRGGVSKPQGEAQCVGCRSSTSPPRALLLTQCATCSRMFETTKSNVKYCNRECSPWNRRTRAQRNLDYGTRHQQIRSAFAVLVDQGNELCCLCSDPINPGSAWDLDHTPDREGYRGAAHAGCNRADGARQAHQRKSLKLASAA